MISLGFFLANCVSIIRFYHSLLRWIFPNQNFQTFNLSFSKDTIKEISLDELFRKKCGYETVITDYPVPSLKKQNISVVSSREVTDFELTELAMFSVIE